MKEFLKRKKVIIELGSGNGCLKKIIKKKKYNTYGYNQISLDKQKSRYAKSKSW